MRPESKGKNIFKQLQKKLRFLTDLLSEDRLPERLQYFTELEREKGHLVLGIYIGEHAAVSAPDRAAVQPGGNCLALLQRKIGRSGRLFCSRASIHVYGAGFLRERFISFPAMRPRNGITVFLQM